jgi:hypothetical protein
MTVELLIACALAVAGGASAHAASPEQREAEAYKACAAGRVAAGIEILAELLVAHGHPNYVYNQARCYQQNGRAAEALSRFREYQRLVPNEPSEQRARVDRYVHELEVELARVPAPRAEVVPAAATDVPAVPASAIAPAVPPHRLRTLGWISSGVAIAGVAAGIVAGLQIRSLAQELETAPSAGYTVDDLAERQRRADGWETMEWIGYGVGAAAALGAAVAFAIDARGAGDAAIAGSRSATSGTLRATACLHRRGGASLVFVGRF